MKRLVVLACLLAVVGSLSVPALCADYSLKLVGVPSATGNIYIGQWNQWETVYIGPVLVQVTNLSTQVTTTQRMLCVDLLGTITMNQVWAADLTNEVPTQATADAWDKAVWIANHNNGWATASGWDTSVYTAAEQDAAVQTAVWETIQDSANFDLGAGAFRLGTNVNGADYTDVKALAESYFNSANPYSGYGSTQQWYNACTTGQDMLFFVADDTPDPEVPEIPTMLLGSFGLTMIGAIRRKLARS